MNRLKRPILALRCSKGVLRRGRRRCVGRNDDGRRNQRRGKKTADYFFD